MFKLSRFFYIGVRKFIYTKYYLFILKSLDILVRLNFLVGKGLNLDLGGFTGILKLSFFR